MSLQVGFIASLKNEKSHVIVEQVSTPKASSLQDNVQFRRAASPNWCPACRHAKRWAAWSTGGRARQTTTQGMVPGS